MDVMNLRDQWVRFKIRDIYHPDYTNILSDLHGNDLLSGQVVDLSDDGMHKDAFVIVEVEGIEHLVIVAVDRLVNSV
jgi:hypothetical protein